MARTVVGYIGANGINNMASASPTGSIEPATGLPIATGLNPGAFRELGVDLAAQFSYQNPLGTYAWGGPLYDGLYYFVQLDPAVTTDPIPLGTCLAWLPASESSTGGFTQVTTFSATNTDFAGVSIDSNFGKSHPYAFIQCQGKVNIQFDAAASFAHIGDYVSLSVTDYGKATNSGAQNTATTALQLGVALVASGTALTRQLVRITRAMSRF